MDELYDRSKRDGYAFYGWRCSARVFENLQRDSSDAIRHNVWHRADNRR